MLIAHASVTILSESTMGLTTAWMDGGLIVTIIRYIYTRLNL